jgi:predicted metal-dependent hydrolase
MHGACSENLMKAKCLARPIPLGSFKITLSNKTIPYSLKRSFRAKLIWLDIKRQTGLTVTIPPHYNLKYLPAYLQSNTKWILRNFEKYCGETSSIPSQETRPSNTIPYLGKCLKVTQRRLSKGPNVVVLQQNQLIVSLNSAGLSVLELERWLRIQASKIIKEKVKIFTQQMGIFYNRVVIRDQKSRWGSCSCLKNLNFSWRLIMAPEPVLDYVIIHEICHLKEMNHSTSFWNIVSQYCPQWHEYRNWLDNHNSELIAQLSL